MERDKYGNYINDNGVVIEIHDDKRGKTHISFYDDDIDKDHNAIHVNYDTDTGKGTISDHNKDKTDKSKTDISCYLTTACMRYYKEDFDNNCYELRMMRWLRDNVVSDEDVFHYYKTAPYIVEGINNSGYEDTMYKLIYKNMISSCISLIEKKNYDDAYTVYKGGFIALEDRFAKPYLEEKLVKVLKRKVDSYK